MSYIDLLLADNSTPIPLKAITKSIVEDGNNLTNFLEVSSWVKSPGIT